MNKKGDMSINIIVVAAIALLLLVLIAYLVTDALNNVNEGTDCEGVRGHCDPYATCWTTNDQYPGNWIPTVAYDCKDPAETCCIKA